jgi:hypothetical protein
MRRGRNSFQAVPGKQTLLIREKNVKIWKSVAVESMRMF